MSVLRRADAGDVDDLLVLVREFYELDRHDFDESRIRLALVPLLAGDERGQVWLLSDDPSGDLLGYAVVTWGWSLESGGRDALLDEIYVRVQGAGLGRRLLTRAMREAAEAGASRMFLETEAHNQRVRGFYASLEFTIEPSVWMSADLEVAQVPRI